MTSAATAERMTSREIKAEIHRRIHDRVWPPGDLLPTETALAEEFSCARATVNKALRELANDGVIERRRRAGTRVAVEPIRRAQLAIPIVRVEVEENGARYGHRVIEANRRRASRDVRETMQLQARYPVYYIRTLHLADGATYAIEERWVNLATVPEFESAPLDAVSANEWLVREVGYTHGDYRLEAVGASHEAAQAFAIVPGTPLLSTQRLTWRDSASVTLARTLHRPNHRLKLQL